MPVTAATVFQSGSVGKQFTATLVKQLVGEGKLSLDDRLTKFFPDGPTAWRDITIRQMLSHTSGISEKFYSKIDLHLEYADSTVARIIGEQSLDFVPGSKWSYSNPAYVMLGYETANGHRIIEHGGAWQGFKTFIARYVGDGLTVIVLMNLGEANPGTFAHGIAAVIDPALRASAPAAARP